MLPVNRHRLWQIAADAGLIALAWWLAFQLRFDFDVPANFRDGLWTTVAIVVAIKLAVFVAFGFYNRWWRYVSTKDMWRAALGVVVASVIAAYAIYFIDPFERRLPRGVALMDGVLLLGLVAGSRLLARSIFERPSASRLVARGKEVIVVGAGDAGQLVIKEMQRSRQLGYTPIGIVDDDPAQEEPPRPRRPRPRDHGRAPPRPPRQPPGRAPDRDPLRVGRAAPARRRGRAPRERAREDAAGSLRADRRRGQPRRADPAGAGGGRPRPRARRGRPGGDLVVPRRRDGARHRRRRLDRVGALPPDRARETVSADPPRPGRDAALRDRARARGRAPVHRQHPGARRRLEPAEAGAGLRALPAGGRLPRRGLQARPADGGEPARVHPQQRARDEGRRGHGGRSSAPSASSSSRPTRRSTRRPSTASARRSPSGSSRRTAAGRTSRPGSWPCASATCSARRAA